MVKVFYPYLCPKGHTITPKLNFCPKCCRKCSIKFNFNISNVWCQIVLVPNCPVPNCPGVKLSECQIVHFYYLKSSIWPFLLTLNDLLNFDHFRHTAHIYRSSPVKDNCNISVVLSFNNQLSDRPVLARF